MKQYTYCIKNVKNGSAACTSPKVIWITGSGQAVPCPDKGNGCITIQVPDDISACVSGEIICENCGDCPSKPFTICPCSTAADCDNCQTCNNGICTDICSGPCINGQCLDCITSDDCTANEICVNGKCQCPPSSPYKNSHGDCVECLGNNNCAACEVCIGGECVAKECPEGVCNPTTGFCVQCVNSGDCTSRTDGKHCCTGIACECCSGFIWNPQTNMCDPAPECTVDADCPVCQICVGGNCQPRVCPTGYICINDNCVEICDCDNPACGRNASCIRYNATTCICQECSGYCTDDVPCREGCICVNNNCTANPCNAPCATGADCGVGCGCLDNQCVPCEYLSCSTDRCGLADGCNCYGSQCKADPCKGPCDNGADCGPGCGCLNGNCVSCDSIDCTECQGVLGCKCTNGICLKNAPCSGNCVSSYDCEQGCTCYNGKCVNCSNFACEDCNIDDCECVNSVCQGVDNKACNDVFTLAKVEGTCDLKATLVKERDCVCEELDAQLRIVNKVPQTMVLRGISVPAYKFTYQIRILRNGSDIGSPIINDKFIGGIIRVKATYTYTDSTAVGIFEDSVYADYDFTGLSTDVNKILTFPSRMSTTSGGKVINVKTITITADIITPLAHTNNCVYRGVDDSLELIVKEYANTPNINDTDIAVLESSDVRSPLFRWSRSANLSMAGADSEFRYVYATSLGTNTWEDTIEDCNDGLCSGLYYKVTDDCSCKDGSNVLKAVFCPDPFTLDYTVSNCGRTLVIDDIFDPCDINGIISPCSNCSLNMNVTNPVVFLLEITDSEGLVTSDSLTFNTPADVIGNSYTTVNPIETIKLTHSHDSTCKFEEDVVTSTLNPAITHSCSTNQLTVNTGLAGCTVRLYEKNNTGPDPLLATTVTDINGQALFVGVVSGEYRINTVCGACEADKNIDFDCCQVVNGVINASYNNGTLALQLVSGDAGQQYDYILLKPNNTTVTIGTNQPLVYNHAISLTNGNYSISATDNNGCVHTGTFVVNNCDTLAITGTVNYTYVAGPPVVETISVTGIAGSTSPYTVALKQGNTVIATNAGVIASTSFNAAALVSGTTYTISITDSQNPSCTKNLTYILNKSAQCDPAVDLTITGSGNCSPVQYNFWINEAVVNYTIKIKQGGALIPNGQTGQVLLAGPTSSTYIVSSGQDPQGRDLYYLQNLPDGTYAIEVTDSRGCTDTETVMINCVCSNPIIADISGIECDETGAGVGHRLIINNITGGEQNFYNIYVYAGNITGGNTCQPQALIAQTTSTTGEAVDLFIPSGDIVPAPGNYYVKITDGNGGICNTSCIAVVSRDCEDGGGGGFTGSPDCPLEEADFLITGDCALNITNNSAITVTVWVQAVASGDCQSTDPADFIGLNTAPQVLAPAAVGAFTVPYPGLEHRFMIKYSKQVNIGDPVPCTLYICAPCSTTPSCNLTEDPEVCKTSFVGAGGVTYYKLFIKNNNNKTVKIEGTVNGGPNIEFGYAAAGATIQYTTPSLPVNVYVNFICMNDLDETRDITVNPVSNC